MSLYNMLHGYNPAARFVLAVLKLDPRSDIPRFRDAFVERRGGDPVLVVFTRTGGGNRDDYAVGNAILTQHSRYLDDEDDDFDSTYARFYFKTEGEDEQRIATDILDELGEPQSLEERTNAFIKKMREPS